MSMHYLRFLVAGLILAAGCSPSPKPVASAETKSPESQPVSNSVPTVTQAPAVPATADEFKAEPAVPVADKKAGVLPIPPPYPVPTNQIAEPDDGTAGWNVATTATVTVSSTHTGLDGEGPPRALVDGDPKTRWSSEYKAPQSIVLDFGKPVTVHTVKLHWERASATCYSVEALVGTGVWRNVHLHLKMDQEPKDRVDEIPFRRLVTPKLRFSLQKNVNPDWGFSLYEIEVVGHP